VFDSRTAKILLTILAFALVLAIAYIARAVLVVFVFAILFAYLIDPVVRFLQRHSLFFKNLRGPHVLEAYLAFLGVILLLAYFLAPQVQKNGARLLNTLPAIADRVSTGQIANDLGNNFGWTDTQSDRVKTFLQQHRSMIESSVDQISRFASTLLAGILVIPILAIFFLSDGENLANQVLHLVSTRTNHASMRSLASQLHKMLQHYIRAKVTLGGLSLLYCLVTMLIFGFPHSVALAVLAGILEFIPVAGWMAAAVTILSAGALAHAHWIWMLALLCFWRILMDYCIAPRVMGHELEMHPLLAIFTLMVGGAVGGIIGIYLSVPLAATLRVVYRNLVSAGSVVPERGASNESLTLASSL
jgi:predicted PurR-regulated permease PerM